MKLNLIKWANVIEHIGNDNEMLKAFSKFYNKLKLVDWKKPSDISSTFNTADMVRCEKSNRVIFNVGGNKYRLICGYHFTDKTILLFIKFAGSHKEYDVIDACKVNMFK